MIYVGSVNNQEKVGRNNGCIASLYVSNKENFFDVIKIYNYFLFAIKTIGSSSNVISLNFVFPLCTIAG